MRLWTVHPRYLDAKGLVALWREGLLAKAVLEGKTKGYQKHPQLIRFRVHAQPFEVLWEYLRVVLAESQSRGYCFDNTKLPPQQVLVEPIIESQGQLAYEWQHLLKKLADRDSERFRQVSIFPCPEHHPSFVIVPGGIQDWEHVV